MTRGIVKSELEVILIANDAKDTDALVEKLMKAFPGADISVDDNNYITLEDEETAKYYYSAPVYYTSNGDGSPAEYEDELSFYDDDDALDYVLEACRGIDYEITEINFDKIYPED